jgi:hypothetical protein
MSFERLPSLPSSTMAPKRERVAKGIRRVVDRLQAPFSPSSRAPSPQPGSTSDLIGGANPPPAFPIPHQPTTQPLPPQGLATPGQLTTPSMPSAGPLLTTPSPAPIVANKLSEASTSDLIGAVPLYLIPNQSTIQPPPPQGLATSGQSTMPSMPSPGPAPTAPPASSAPIAVNKLSEAWTVARNGLETTLRLLEKSVDACPPLKSAVGGLVGCLDIIQVRYCSRSIPVHFG